MSDTDTTAAPIAPALSEADWKSGGKLFGTRGAAVIRDGRLCVDELSLHGPERAALAALALWGQPEGFGHADVAALRRSLDNAERWIASRMLDPRDDAALTQARSAVDRLAALLPPEG